MKNKVKVSCLLLASGIGLVSFIKTGNEPQKKPIGVDLASMDTTVKPGDDFFQYVNGNWLKKTEIPASESSWGSFNELRDKALKRLKGILEESVADKSAPKGSVNQLVGDFYYTATDSAKQEKDGITPLKPYFDKINAIKTKADFANLVGEFHSIGVNTLFNFYIGADDKNSNENLLALYQGGIGLPDRDYYTRTDEDTKNIRAKYVEHLERMFVLLGDTKEKATKNAEVVMQIENVLAKASRTNVELRDPQANYNKQSLTDLLQTSPDFDWNGYFNKVGAKTVATLNVSQPDFFKGLSNEVKAVSIEDWKTYLRWSLINETATKLSSAFVNEQFEFNGKVLQGLKAPRPRWKRALATTDNALGEAVGQLFVKKYFTPEAKKRVNEMVDNLSAVHRERIKSREWMSEETKKQALVKLDAITRKLGYPDKWKDYKGLEISRASYVTNAFNANAYEFKRMIAKLGKPVDKTEWGMSPPTVNAYYNPGYNEIVFPAGIMQYPFFDADQDDALNYGGIGAVIGHEITHGFDDQGSQYDAQGNMKNWWTETDNKNFKDKTGEVVTQYNNYIAIDSLHVNGELTLGENIADLGGLTMAYYAYKKYLQTHPSKKIDGFTPEQRLFIGWSKIWNVKYRPQSLKQQVLTNPHSPGNFRSNGPLTNMKEFYEAFNVKPGDKMYKPEAQRTTIW